MIYIDDTDPEGVLEPAFPSRDVTIKRNTDAHQLYDILSEVGRGKFGTVYKCQEKTTGLKLAAKFVPIPKREDKRNVEREVEIMNSLQHHLIIQLYAAYEYQKMMCVVLELIEGGELFDRVVDDEFVLTERVCSVFIRQVCEAMEFIHRNNILHLDLKPENILCLTQQGNRIKVIDFGLARKFDPDKRLQILFGTPEFVAPEVVNFDCISYGTDMWSVGVICYVLISGLSPFMGETDIETMANVTIAKYDFEDDSFSNVSPECLDFISQLLVKDLSIRMTAEQCLKHKWLQRRPATIATTAATTTTTKMPSNNNNTIQQNAATTTAITPVIPSTPATPANMPIELSNKAVPETLKPPQTDNNNVAMPKDAATEQKEGLTPVKDVLETKELDTTKDNLKNFIERWEEHPNSPYVFDVEGNVIAPLNETAYIKPHNNADSISSSRVCSPSPCESISTLTDYEDVFLDETATTTSDLGNDSPKTLATPINESREKLFPSTASLATASGGGYGSGSGGATPTPQHLFNDDFNVYSNSNRNARQQREIKSYLHTFDRRNSDTNYLLGRRASGERVNLADEIRKLSDHLLMLAEINTKLVNDAQNVTENESKKTTTTGTSTGTTTTSAKSTNSTGKSKSTSKTTKSSTTQNKDGSSRSTKISSLSVRLQQSIEETPKLSNGSTSASTKMSRSTTWSKQTSATSSTTKTSTSSSTSINNSSSSTSASSSSTTPKVNYESVFNRRAKFRINQMSRDVPIGLPDTHQTVNLEEAATTAKDCLLHLLEKYNESKCRNPMGRHQSISVDWHVSDNLEYRSMSSINAFFQRHTNTGQKVKTIQAQLEEKAAGK